jgi:hypothetical protein
MTSSSCNTDKGMIVLVNQSSNRVAALIFAASEGMRLIYPENIASVAANVIDQNLNWLNLIAPETGIARVAIAPREIECIAVPRLGRALPAAGMGVSVAGPAPERLFGCRRSLDRSVGRSPAQW